MSTFVEARLRTGTNWTTYTIIQRWRELTFDTKYLDAGAINIAIPNTDATAMGIDDLSVIEIAPNGVSMIDGWYYIDGTSGTKVADDELWTTYSGKSLCAMLDEAIVYPSAWPSVTPAGHAFGYPDVTAGTILRTLIDRARTDSWRGGLQWLDAQSFTGTTTSNGTAWNSHISKTYDTGMGLFQVLMDLAANGMISWRMNGRQLLVYNLDEMCVHHPAGGAGGVTVRRGQNIIDQNTNTNADNWASHVLVAGDQNQAVVRGPSATGPPRRRESYQAASGITDLPSLNTIGDFFLKMAHKSHEETVTATDDTAPWSAYVAGDWVWEDVDGTLVNYQVMQIAGAVADDSSVVTAGLTLGDMLTQQDAKINRTITAMTNGGGASVNSDPNDGMAPAVTGSVNFTATPYRDSNGHDFNQVTVTWAAPTTNTDGSPLTDLDHYDLGWSTAVPPAVAGTNWTGSSTVESGSTVAHLSTLPCGKSCMFRVRAVDSSGNASPWVMSVAQTLPIFVVVPPTPSTPGVMGAIRAVVVIWDGLTDNGGTYPSSWSHTEVHTGTAATFTPNNQTLAGSMSTRGGRTMVQEAEGTAYYARLVAVDKSGNRSLPSAASAAVTPTAIDTQALADHSVTAAKIGNAAITTAQLSIGTFGDSTLPNGSFTDPASSADDTTGSAHWKVITPPSTGATYARDTATYIEGTSSQRVSLAAGTTAVGCFGNSGGNGGGAGIPTAIGDIWYVKFKAQASVNAVTTVRAQLSCAYDAAHLGVVNDANNPWVNFVGSDEDAGPMTALDSTGATAPLETQWEQYEGQLVVPDGLLNPLILGQLIFTATHPTNNGAVNVWVDDVVLLPVKGSAYIPEMTVGSASIVNMVSDKLVTGSIYATDITADSLSGGVEISDATMSTTDIVMDDEGGTLLVYAVSGGTAINLNSDTPGVGNIVNDAAHGLGITDVIKVECWGAGGGGQAGRSGAGGGFGGSGGEYARETQVAVTSGRSYPYQIGTGGTASPIGASPANADDGGNTYFTGDTGTAVGQGKTVTAHGGRGARGNNVQAGGTGSKNQKHFNGGKNNVANSVRHRGGNSGGSSAGWSATGRQGTAATGATGAGTTAAPTGGGAGGKGGNGGATRTVGENGVAPGGGGGGGASDGSNALPHSSHNSTGGHGGSGRIRWTYGRTVVLVMSLASVAGTDAYGNKYPVGLRFYEPGTTKPPGSYARDAAFTLNLATGTSYTFTANMTTIKELSDVAALANWSNGVYTVQHSGFWSLSMGVNGAAQPGCCIQRSVDGGLTWTSRFSGQGGWGGSAGPNWSWQNESCGGTIWLEKGDKLRFGARQVSGATATVEGWVGMYALP
jgi:hypothetical protein